MHGQIKENILGYRNILHQEFPTIKQFLFRSLYTITVFKDIGIPMITCITLGDFNKQVHHKIDLERIADRSNKLHVVAVNFAFLPYKKQMLLSCPCHISIMYLLEKEELSPSDIYMPHISIMVSFYHIMSQLF